MVGAINYLFLMLYVVTVLLALLFLTAAGALCEASPVYCVFKCIREPASQLLSSLPQYERSNSLLLSC